MFKNISGEVLKELRRPVGSSRQNRPKFGKVNFYGFYTLNYRRLLLFKPNFDAAISSSHNGGSS